MRQLDVFHLPKKPHRGKWRLCGDDGSNRCEIGADRLELLPEVVWSRGEYRIDAKLEDHAAEQGLRMRLRARKQRGGALIMVLVITTLIGSVLVAYLSMLKSQNIYASRSLAWNTAMPMAEAGVEEALAHINYSGTTNLSSDGWTKNNNQ